MRRHARSPLRSRRTRAGGITIDAAVLALTQSFVVNNYGSGSDEGPLNVYGSIQQFARGPVGTFNGVNTVSGYMKHYTWNPLLNFASPPSYLVPSTAPWVLSSVNANGGEHTTTVCPPLTGIYNGTTTSTPDHPVLLRIARRPARLSRRHRAVAPHQRHGHRLHRRHRHGHLDRPVRQRIAHHPLRRRRQPAVPRPAPALSVSGATATSATITGLTPGTAYVFMVTATNAYGTSDPSNPTPSVTAPSVPYAPTLVTAVGNVNDTVTVNWTDPSSVGSPITQYTITPSPGLRVVHRSHQVQSPPRRPPPSAGSPSAAPTPSR